jgi:DNA replication protein DnaC
MHTVESRDAYEIFTERQRTGSMVVTSNRNPAEWLSTLADPVRARSAIDRFTGNAHDLVVKGQRCRPRHEPSRSKKPVIEQPPRTKRRNARRLRRTP